MFHVNIVHGLLIVSLYLRIACDKRRRDKDDDTRALGVLAGFDLHIS